MAEYLNTLVHCKVLNFCNAETIGETVHTFLLAKSQENLLVNASETCRLNEVPKFLKETWM